MKKILPKSFNNPSGFTLIELLVVVAIIAILSVIGFSVFANAQKNARDGRRKADITSLARSIESSKVPGSTTYQYNNTSAANDYPNGFSSDPVTGRSYCIATSITSGTAPIPPTNNSMTTSTGCPFGGSAPLAITSSTLTLLSTNAQTAPLVGNTATSWVLCASLEATGTTPFCVKSGDN